MQDQFNAAVASLQGYIGVVANGLGFMLGAMLIVFLLYKLVSSLIRPTGKVARMVQVAFGAVYVMIIVLAVILAAERSGYDVSGFAGIAILAVMVGAVVVFFMIPFLPRLPFTIGDLVTIRGSTGTVDAITTTQTVLRTFDGKLVYIPNVTMLGADIENYSTVPIRRIELKVEVHVDDDIEAGRQLMHTVMRAEERVLADPEPAVFVTGLEKGVVSLLGLCWVANADWFGTRDALIVEVAKGLNSTADVRPVIEEITVHSAPATRA